MIVNRSREAERYFAESLRNPSRAMKPCIKTRPTIAELEKQTQGETAANVFGAVVGLVAVVGFLTMFVHWLCS